MSRAKQSKLPLNDAKVAHQMAQMDEVVESFVATLCYPTIKPVDVNENKEEKDA
jgi:hypothetical protein